MQHVIEIVQTLAAGEALALYALGGAVLVCVLVDALVARFAVAALFGLVAIILYQSSERAFSLTDSHFLDTLLFVGLTLAVAILFSLVLRIPVRHRRRWVPMRARLRQVLMPSLWNADAATISARNRTKRWFVAVAAATGCWAGTLMAAGSFWEALLEALEPGRILVLLAITIVVIILIGPVEEYVLGGHRVIERSEAGVPTVRDHERLLEELWQQFSWRALGRILLVILVGFQLNVIHSSLEHVATQPSLVAIAFVTVVGPLIVTYYWSAAMQAGVASISRRAGWAAVNCFLVILWPLGLVLFAGGIALLFGMLPLDFIENGFVRAVLTVPLFLIAVAVLALVLLILGIATAAVPSVTAFLGGLVLNWARRRPERSGVPATLALGGVILVAVVVFVAIQIGVFVLSGLSPFRTATPEMILLSLLSTLLPTVGWTFGMVLAGFPQIIALSLPVPMPAAARPARRGWRSSAGYYLGKPAVGIAAGCLGWAALSLFMVEFTNSGTAVRIGLNDRRAPLSEKLEIFAAMETANGLPVVLAPTMKLVAVDHSEDTITYTYETTLPEVVKANIGAPAAKASVAQGVCSGEGTRLILTAGAKIVFVYRDTAGAELGRLEATQADCTPGPPLPPAP